MNTQLSVKKYNVQINCYIKFILKDKKGSRAIYDKLVSVTQIQKQIDGTES